MKYIGYGIRMNERKNSAKNEQLYRFLRIGIISNKLFYKILYTYTQINIMAETIVRQKNSTQQVSGQELYVESSQQLICIILGTNLGFFFVDFGFSQNIPKEPWIFSRFITIYIPNSRNGSIVMIEFQLFHILHDNNFPKRKIDFGHGGVISAILFHRVSPSRYLCG